MYPLNQNGVKTFIAQLFWSDALAAFDERNSVKSWAQLGDIPRPLSFLLPSLPAAPRAFRLVLTHVPIDLLIHGVEVLNPDDSVAWTWDGTEIYNTDVRNGATKDAARNAFLDAQCVLRSHGRTVVFTGLEGQSSCFQGGCRIAFSLSCDAKETCDADSPELSDNQQLRVLASTVRQLRQELQITGGALDNIYRSKSWSWLLKVRNGLQKTRSTLNFKRSTAADAPVVSLWPEPSEHARVLPNIGTVNVVVPVYRGIAETKRCLESVLNSLNRTKFDLIVIDDCSPEPDMQAYLRSLSDEGLIRLIVHRQNLGYTRTVNEGIALDPKRDVVLLNSDTEVANDWLDKLLCAAYSNARVATVTPFSNQATLCSYPKAFAGNAIPQGWTTQSLDRLMDEYNRGKTALIPTAVGFCMYIRRDCLKRIGTFDSETFPGYAEENDFCLRASKAGLQNILAADTFVYHKGEVSFAGEAKKRQEAALAKLRLLYPDYDAAIASFAAYNSTITLRQRIDLARLKRSHDPMVLHILPEIGGGTESHIDDFAETMGSTVVCLRLRILPKELILHWVNNGEVLSLHFNRKTEYHQLMHFLKSLPLVRAHVHHVIYSEELVKRLVKDLALPFDFTAHDYFTVCPLITLTNETGKYCGQPGERECNKCIAVNAPTGTPEIREWRNRHSWLYSESERVFVPSLSAEKNIRKYVRNLKCTVASHPDKERTAGYTLPRMRAVGVEEPLRIAVLGALSEAKGADTLEECAIAAAEADAPLEFHLIGFGYRPLKGRPKSNLVVHGEYSKDDLKELLKLVRPHVVWFPARWPETYSYTLSTCLEMELPVVAPDIGAFPERLSRRPWSWVQDWNQPAEEWLDFFLRIRENNFRSANPPEPLDDTAATPNTFEYRRDYLRQHSSSDRSPAHPELVKA